MISDEIIESISAPKALSGEIRWSDDGSYNCARIPLIVDGIGVAGLFARLKVKNTVDAFGSPVQLEWDNRVETTHLSRLDWRVGHTNPNKGPQDLRLRTMDSTHFHRFDLNYLPSERRMLQKNLPLAEPLEPDPPSLEEFFILGGKMLRIEGLARIARPPFQVGLF